MKRNFIIILLIGILIGLTACRDKSSLNTAVEDKKELSLIELSKTLALQMSKGNLRKQLMPYPYQQVSSLQRKI